MLAILIVFRRRRARPGLSASSAAPRWSPLSDSSTTRGWLHHQIKLFAGMPLAAVILLISGNSRPGPSVLSFAAASAIGWTPPLTVVWVVGITASFSILDHMDGLCAGCRCHGLRLLHHARVSQRPDPGGHARRVRPRRLRRLPALEFQTGENFHGRMAAQCSSAF